MKITEMTDYQMGYEDYKAGFPPISDYDPSNPEDVEYMRGYIAASWDAQKK